MGTLLTEHRSFFRFFLSRVGYSVGIDGVNEGFYLDARIQGKAYRHNIKDEVSTRERGFIGFCSLLFEKLVRFVFKINLCLK